jgi:hypothetical protein
MLTERNATVRNITAKATFKYGNLRLDVEITGN